MGLSYHLRHSYVLGNRTRSPSTANDIKRVWKPVKSCPGSFSETQGFNGDGTGRERLGAGKRWGEGKGRKREKGKPWEASLYR